MAYSHEYPGLRVPRWKSIDNDDELTALRQARFGASSQAGELFQVNASQMDAIAENRRNLQDNRESYRLHLILTPDTNDQDTITGSIPVSLSKLLATGKRRAESVDTDQPDAFVIEGITVTATQNDMPFPVHVDCALAGRPNMGMTMVARCLGNRDTCPQDRCLLLIPSRSKSQRDELVYESDDIRQDPVMMRYPGLATMVFWGNNGSVVKKVHDREYHPPDLSVPDAVTDLLWHNPQYAHEFKPISASISSSIGEKQTYQCLEMAGEAWPQFIDALMPLVDKAKEHILSTGAQNLLQFTMTPDTPEAWAQVYSAVPDVKVSDKRRNAWEHAIQTHLENQHKAAALSIGAVPAVPQSHQPGWEGGSVTVTLEISVLWPNKPLA